MMDLIDSEILRNKFQINDPFSGSLFYVPPNCSAAIQWSLYNNTLLGHIIHTTAGIVKMKQTRIRSQGQTVTCYVGHHGRGEA